MGGEKTLDATLIDFVRDLCLKKTFADVTLLVGDEEIPAHRFVLASQSRHFFNAFSSEDSCPGRISNLRTDADTLKLILR